MTSKSVVDQIVKSLSFEVEAVPQEDVTKLTSTSKSTPLSVKIRVRKKEECGMQQGYISVTKSGHSELKPERIRLISSDQTIMSFDVSLEADFVKKTKRKPRRKLFFGGCLGANYDDDDEVPYIPCSTYNAKITDTSTSSKSDGVMIQTFTLSKTKYEDIKAQQQNTKKQGILGKCKPGGCLDPPFSEDKYSYEPIPKLKNNSRGTATRKESQKNSLTRDDNGHRTPKELKQLSKDSLIEKARADDSISILSLYNNSKKGSLDSKYSDYVITYPPVTSLKDNAFEKISRNSEEKSRKSYNDNIEAFFTTQKKNSRFSENSSNIVDETKTEKDKTIVPIFLPKPLYQTNSNVFKDETINTDNGKTFTPMEMGNDTNTASDFKSETAQSNFPKHTPSPVPIPLADATSVSKSDESHILSQFRKPAQTSQRKTILNSESDTIVGDSTAALPTNNLKLDNSNDNMSYTNNLVNTKTSISISLSLMTPLGNATNISKSAESQITLPHVQDSKSPDSTDMESEGTAITRRNKAALHTNNSKLKENMSYIGNHETLETSIPTLTVTPLPFKDSKTISNSERSHIISTQLQDSPSPKNIGLNPEPAAIVRGDKAAMFTKIYEELLSFSDSFENLKTYTSISLVNATTISKSDKSLTMPTHVRDSTPPNNTDIKSKPTAITGNNKAASPNNLILHDLKNSSPQNTLEDSKITLKSEGLHIISTQLQDSPSLKNVGLKSELAAILKCDKAALFTYNLEEHLLFTDNIENLKTNTSIPLVNATTISKSDESVIISTYAPNSTLPNNTDMKSQPPAIAGSNKAASPNNFILHDIQNSTSLSSSPTPTHIPPLANSKTLITSSYVRDSISFKNIVTKSKTTAIAMNNKVSMSTNNSVLNDLQTNSSYTGNLDNPKTSFSMPLPIPIPLDSPIVNTTTISKSDGLLIRPPNVQDSVYFKKNNLDLEPTAIGKGNNKTALTTNNSNGLDHSQDLSSSGVNFGNTETSIRIPSPISVNTTSIFKEQHIISRDPVTPIKTDIQSEPTVMARNDKTVLPTNKSKLESLQKKSSYTDSFENDKTIISIPSPTPLLNALTVSKSDESHTISTHARDSASSIRTDIVSVPTSRSRSNIPALSTKNSKTDDSQEQSSYTDNLQNAKCRILTSLPISIPVANAASILEINESDMRSPYVQNLASTKIAAIKLESPMESPNLFNLVEPVLESNPMGSAKSLLLSVDENDFSSYCEPPDENKTVLSNKSSDKNLNHEGHTMQDLSENSSTPGFKTETKNYSEETLRNQFGVMPSTNGSQNNGHTMGKSERNTLLTKIPNLPKSDTVVADHFVNPHSDVDNIFQKSNANDQINPIKNNDHLAQNNLNRSSDFSLSTNTAILKNNKIIITESVSDVHTSKAAEDIISSSSSNIDTKVIKIQPVLSENYDYNEETEYILQDKRLPLNNIGNTLVCTNRSSNESSKDNLDAEPIKYNRFLKTLNKEDNISNINDHSNLNHNNISNFTQSTLNQPNLPKTDSTQIIKLEGVSQSKQGSFIKQSPSVIKSLNTNSIFEMDKTNKHKSTRETLTQLEFRDKGSVNLSKFKMRDNSANSDSKNIKTSITKGSISLDLAFRSYINDRNQRTLKTFEISSDYLKYPDDSVTVIQSHLRSKESEIRIPIDSYNDMTIRMQRTKNPAQPVHRIKHETYGYDKSSQTSSNNHGVPEFANVNNNNGYPKECHEEIYNSEIPTILNSVYEQELLPLHRTINHLKKEIDALASQQSIFIGKLVCARKTPKPVRLIRVNSRCVCFRK